MIALWSPENKTLNSDVFCVPPGKVCVLFATCLQVEKVRVTDIEFKTTQSICVRRIVNVSEGILTQRSSLCDWVYSGVTVTCVADDLVQLCNTCWELNHANNLRIIGVPGTYWLELNDATAIGSAQVYADLYDVNQIPQQVAHLFF